MYALTSQTRAALTAYIAQIAALNGLGDPAATRATFNVTPSVAQTLMAKIQESSDFLKRINMINVPEMEGERLYLGVSGLMASRTDTSGDGRRKTKSPHGMSGWKYRCEKTDFDTHLRYQVRKSPTTSG